MPNHGKLALAAIRSDALRAALNLRDVSPLFRLLLSDVIQIVVVLDASAVQGELRWRLGSRNEPTARTALHEAIASGAVIAVAPTFLKQEIEKYLAIIASEMDATTEAARAEWERVQCMIRFFAPRGDGAEFASIDPKDSSYAQTAEELDADFVRTSDKHFTQMGVATLGPDLDGVLRNYVRTTSVVVAVKIGSSLSLIVGGQALIAMVRGIPEVIRRLPSAVKLTLGVAAVVAVLHPQSRQKLIQLSGKLSGRARELKPLFADAVSFLGEAAITSKATGDTIKSRLRARARGKQTALDYARQVCLRSALPLTSGEIAHRILVSGYSSRSKTFPSYVRRILREDSTFVRSADGRWTFRNE